MRTFKCYDCQHSWQLPHGEGGRGVDLVCPKCGSKNLHREDRGWGRSETVVPAAEAPGRGRQRRGRRWAA
jgi:DNA-directed RNA polymerase subunit RPC12/RpoP